VVIIYKATISVALGVAYDQSVEPDNTRTTPDCNLKALPKTRLMYKMLERMSKNTLDHSILTKMLASVSNLTETLYELLTDEKETLSTQGA
jgi:hypothetical protein